MNDTANAGDAGYFREVAARLNLPPQDMLLLMKSGFTPSDKVTKEELDDTLRRIKNAVGSGDDDSLESILERSDDVHLIFLEDALRNIVYATISYGGKVRLTTDSEGNLSRDYVYDSPDAIFDALIKSGLPKRQPLSVKHRTKVKTKNDDENEEDDKKDKDDKKPKRRPRPQFMFDPELVSYMERNADFMVWEYCQNPGKSNKKRIRSPSELESILPEEMLKRSHRQGLAVYAQTREGFLREHSRQLGGRRQIYLSGILNNDEVNRAIVEFLDKNFGNVEGSKDIDYDKLMAFAQIHSNGRKVYEWFSEKPVTDVTTADVIGGLREQLLIANKLNPEIVDKISASTLSWIAIAKAGDFVNKDEFMCEKVIPYFEKIKEYAGSEEERHQYELSDRVYWGVLHLAEKVLDPEDTYSFKNYTFAIRGLWVKGLLLSDKKMKAQNGDPERTYKGAKVVFEEPVSHLAGRYAVWDPVLKRAFDQMVDEGSVPSHLISDEGSLVLENRRSFSALGTALYEQIHPDRPTDVSETVFVRKDNSQVLVPPGRENSFGTLDRTLPLYVGLNREYFKERFEEGR